MCKAGHELVWYEDIIWNACVEVAATLPRLPRMTDADLAEVAALVGSDVDPALLHHIRDESTDPVDGLHARVRGESTLDDIPQYAVAQVLGLIQARIATMQQTRRVSGDAALALLHSGQHCEMLVRCELPLAYARTEIRGGHVHPL